MCVPLANKHMRGCPNAVVTKDSPVIMGGGTAWSPGWVSTIKWKINVGKDVEKS